MWLDSRGVSSRIDAPGKANQPFKERKNGKQNKNKLFLMFFFSRKEASALDSYVSRSRRLCIFRPYIIYLIYNKFLWFESNELKFHSANVLVLLLRRTKGKHDKLFGDSSGTTDSYPVVFGKQQHAQKIKSKELSIVLFFCPFFKIILHFVSTVLAGTVHRWDHANYWQTCAKVL